MAEENKIVMPQIGVVEDKNLGQLPLDSEKVIYVPESGEQYIDIDGTRVKISDIVDEGFVNGAGISLGSDAIDPSKLIDGKIYKYRDPDAYDGMYVMYRKTDKSSPFIQKDLVPLKKRESLVMTNTFNNLVILSEIADDTLLFSIDDGVYLYDERGTVFNSLTSYNTQLVEDDKVFIVKNSEGNKLLGLNLQPITENPYTFTVHSHTARQNTGKLFDGDFFGYYTTREALTQMGYTEFTYPKFVKKEA